MSSSYKRDDKEFRAHIARLADAGLRFPTDPVVTVPYEPSKMVGETRATLEAHGFTTRDYPYPPQQRNRFNLVGLLAGLLTWALLIAGLVGLGCLIGGVR